MSLRGILGGRRHSVTPIDELPVRVLRSARREMHEIGTTIRVEDGPARRTAVATKELLDDAVTANHYQVGEKDAMGKVIALGEPMTYLDYRGEWVWYIYKFDEAEGKWLLVSIKTKKDEALIAAHIMEK